MICRYRTARHFQKGSKAESSIRAYVFRFALNIGRGVFIESEDRRSSREERFRNVVVPFFESVWPLERTLTSHSLSNALAKLPSKSGTAFAEAVDVIGRFLTPSTAGRCTNTGSMGGIQTAKSCVNLPDRRRRRRF
jgi:hypothetical protein